MAQTTSVNQLANEANIFRYTFSDAELKIAQEAFIFARATLCGSRRVEDSERFTRLSALLCRVRMERTQRHITRSKRRIEQMRNGIARNHLSFESAGRRFGSGGARERSTRKAASLSFLLDDSVVNHAALIKVSVPDNDTQTIPPLYGASDFTDAELMLAYDVVSCWWDTQRTDAPPTCLIRDLLDTGSLFHKIEAETTRRAL